MELSDTIKVMLANHGPLIKPRPGNPGLNPLIMPPKRPGEGGFGNSPLSGIGSSIGNQVKYF